MPDVYKRQVWYPALNIHYSVGVDGISVAMLLLSAIIVFTGTFASWRLQPLTKEYFLWFTFLSIGVFGFFISIDLFTMFMFYEVALIPMYLLIGVWGSGRKEYSAMKLTPVSYTHLDVYKRQPLHIVGLAGFNAVMDYIPGFVWFFGKAFFVVFLLMWIKWTFPRLRIDQILNLEWKYLVPISMVNLILMVLIVVFKLHF